LSNLQSGFTYGISVFIGLILFNTILDPLISNKVFNYLSLFVFLFIFILVVHAVAQKIMNKKQL